MKIWIYADCHIGTTDTLKELELNPDYDMCLKFIEMVKREKPDYVISLGDFTEQIWDNIQILNVAHGDIIAKMLQVTNRFLPGNHDPGDGGIIEMEGIQFLHGHQWERASDGFVERLHKKANTQNKYTVIAHSHIPENGDNFMAVGSLTLTGTFGEIDGSIKRIRTIPKEGVMA